MSTAGIVGPYRYRNFGDDLIGLIMAKALRKAGYDRVLMHGISAENANLAGVFVGSPLGISASSDLLIAGGGHILGDGGFKPSNFYQKLIFKSLLLSKALGRRSMIAAVGAGPLVLKSSLVYASLAARLADRILVRDADSAAFVRRRLVPRSPEKVVQGFDVALLWPDFFCPAVSKKEIVGVQLDPGHVDWPGWLSSELRRVLDGKEVRYISNGVYETKGKSLVGIAGDSCNYSQMDLFLRGLSECSLVITTHLHVAISAYAVGIPTLTLCVNEKTKRFYRDIGHSDRCLSLEGIGMDSFHELFGPVLARCEWTREDDRRLQELRFGAETILGGVK